MASVIKLKRSSTSGSVPTTSDLQTGEIAVNLFDRRLYVSNGAGVTAVGGETFKYTSQDAGEGALLKLLGESSSTSNTVLLRGGNGITVGRDGNGSISFTSTSGGDIDDRMQVANTQSLVNSRLGATATVTLTGDITASETAFSANAVSLSTSLAAGVVDTAELADGAVTSAKIANGGISANAIGNDSVALGTKTTGNYVATVQGTSNEIEVSGSGSETAAVTIGLPDDVSVTAQLNVGENLVVTGNTSVGGDLSVSGDLTVTGATTYLSSSTITIDDGMFKLSANNAGDVTDTGVYAKYVVSGNSAVQYSGYFRDASDSGVFKFYKGLDVEPTATVDLSDTGYELAQVDAIIDGGTY